MPGLPLKRQLILVPVNKNEGKPSLIEIIEWIHWKTVVKTIKQGEEVHLKYYKVLAFVDGEAKTLDWEKIEEEMNRGEWKQKGLL